MFSRMKWGVLAALAWPVYSALAACPPGVEEECYIATVMRTFEICSIHPDGTRSCDTFQIPVEIEICECIHRPPIAITP